MRWSFQLRVKVNCVFSGNDPFIIIESSAFSLGLDCESPAEFNRNHIIMNKMPKPRENFKINVSMKRQNSVGFLKESQPDNATANGSVLKGIFSKYGLVVPDHVSKKVLDFFVS